MEDAIISKKIGDGWLFAVFDGHGGADVSIFCQAVFPRAFEWHLDDLREQVDEEQLVKLALERSIAYMDSIILSKQGRQVMSYIHMLQKVPNFLVESFRDIGQFKEFISLL